MFIFGYYILNTDLKVFFVDVQSMLVTFSGFISLYISTLGLL